MSAVQAKPKPAARRAPLPTRGSLWAGGAAGDFAAPAPPVAQMPLGAPYTAGPALSLGALSMGAPGGNGAGGRAGSGGGATGGGGVQCKLTVGPPGDHFEREADTVAGRVTSGGPRPAITPLGPGALSQMA